MRLPIYTQLQLFNYLVICGYTFIYLIYIRKVVVRAHADESIVNSRLQYNNRHINKLDIKINERIGNDIVIVLDSIRIKVSNWKQQFTTIRILPSLTRFILQDIRWIYHTYCSNYYLMHMFIWPTMNILTTYIKFLGI